MQNASNEPLYKVTAYVTRGDGSSKELLLFRHPSAGIQLPAGTVEEGEDPADAVVREVGEETGLTDVTLVRELARKEVVLSEGKRAVLRTVPILLEPQPDAERHSGVVARNGFWVDAGELVGEYRAIGFYLLEADGDDLRRGKTWTGWALDSALTSREIRCHYELRPNGPTPERWTQFAEDAYDFELFWAPLAECPRLAGFMNDWLALVKGQLVA